jgi:hypothetical protein
MSNPQLHIVSHETIFTDPNDLPTFNSNAIEVHLQNIPGLSRYFIYLNDDFMFSHSMEKEDFFDLKNKEYKVFIDSQYYMQGSSRFDAKNRNDDTERAACPYLQALGYSNQLLDSKYGEKVRRVPAHAPYPIDSKIMNKLQKTFKEEYEASSSNRFRSKNDIQMSFTYNNYLKEELGTT